MVYIKEPIAIIGSACRLPGGSCSPSKLWKLLSSPRNVLSEFPKDRLNLSSFHSENGEDHGSTNVENKSYILQEDPRFFDAAFFNISPREADSMDPQQRLLLEICYEALESAGCTLEQIQGTNTSVFVGSMTNDGYDIQFRDTETMPMYTITGTARSLLSNRISYFFDLKGESLTIDTACSSSLVALHQAVQSLRSGHSTTSIVAGANILLDPGTYIAESKLHMLSTDAQSKMWDRSANGYARGEGVAAIFLKSLSQAIKDGDNIECVVRETFVNSDGRTKGITMPSAAAQAALIRRTYDMAGLDPSVDRCQYFECHGTGTLAGDPQEAQAIQEAFFSNDSKHSPSDKLHLGSIKTIVGHTEGCAGLAGVLKASLAIKNRSIPPNLHFNELNPAITPFYDHLQLATKLTPWPRLSGTPARASVNSFGFGGTNAHAILESYDSDDASIAPDLHDSNLDERFVGPLTFSAKTKSSLQVIIKDFIRHLRTSDSLDLKALTHTVQCKRSSFPVKTFFVGATRQRLLESMDKYIELADAGNENSAFTVHSTKSVEPPGTLGIFTGQGAQWASMGSQLILESRSFRKSIEECEYSLASLDDGPQWSLKEELMADSEKSRMSEAAISQPLCTAIQIALVDLLSAAGIKLDAVVGHSSGEIAATYAAGIICARDAIRIAYYRGYHAKLAQGPQGQPGTMMAVGMSMDDALAFCANPPFSGRISVAASNASAVVTLTGDLDAIEKAKEVCGQEKIFARILQVDTAYHSRHMNPCAGPYLESLRACNIKITPPREDCVWISSVRGDVDLLDEDLGSLADQYWVDNMVKPVLFSQALECSLWNGGPFDMIFEIGPHPALKGPATQTIHSATGSTLPYANSLRRGDDDVKTFSAAVGYIWSYLGEPSVRFDGYRKCFEDVDSPEPKLLKDLPSYAWDHDRIHWIESRWSRNYRLNDETPHELLGRRLPDDSTNEMRWRNILKLTELPWIRGHEFQGQALFPAAAYVTMAVEASKRIAGDRPVKLMEICDFSILHPIVLEENSRGVESIFTIRVSDNDLHAQQDDVIETEFDCYACTETSKGSLGKKCTGRLRIHLGHTWNGMLPPRVSGSPNVRPMDMERFTSSLVGTGLNYQGLFRGLKSMDRTLDYATGTASWSKADLGHQYTVHPAFLDSSFQALFAAFCSPASEGLWTAYLPVGIRRIFINPQLNYESSVDDIKFDVDAFVTESGHNFFQGDLHLFDSADIAGIQIEGLRMTSISEPQAANDRLLFARDSWEADVSSGLHGLENVQHIDASNLADTIERTALYYYQTVFNSIPQQDIQKLRENQQQIVKAISVLFRAIQEGRHPIARKEWLNDSRELISQMQDNFPGQVDLDVSNMIGENLVALMRSECEISELLPDTDVIDRLHTGGYGFANLNDCIARAIKRITFRYPRVKMLEIGAGDGNTTKCVLDTIRGTYSSYTYTTSSSEGLKRVQTRIHGQNNVIYNILDLTKDISDQGFEKKSYDIIIASNVLHETPVLSDSLQRIRSLLRSGGYLILMAATGDLLRLPFLIGDLLGWQNQSQETHHLSPNISSLELDDLLQSSGFSGVDNIIQDTPETARHSCSIIITQAIDDIFSLVRDPLSSIESIHFSERLLIIGGTTLPVAKLIRDIQKLLNPWRKQIHVVKSIEHLEERHLASRTSVICLADLDRPFLASALTSASLETLQQLFSQASNVLWMTSGRLQDDPTSNMIVGIGRALMAELPQINLQFVDSSKTSVLSPRNIVEAFLRLIVPTLPDCSNHDMLWTMEPEIAIDGDQIAIPRVVPDNSTNDRFNSTRRMISSEVSTKDVPVHISSLRGSMVLHAGSFPECQSSDRVRFDTAYSMAMSSKEKDPLYICLGAVPSTGNAAYLLSQVHASSLEVPTNEMLSLESTIDYHSADTLKAIANQLTVDVFRSLVTPEKSVLLYEPDATIADIIIHDDRWNCQKVYFASSRLEPLPDSWISLHPHASERALRKVIPSDVSILFDLSASTNDEIVKSLSNLVDRVECFSISLLGKNRQELLSGAYARLASRNGLYDSHLYSKDLVPVTALVGASTPSRSQPAVVDWTQSTQLTVTIKPLDFSILFSPQKTYLMIGLTGEMGLSLSRFMINYGARHIALASRSAEVNTSWLKEMQNFGVKVEVHKMDVSDRDSVDAVLENIRNTMPPIAGVCNGAMLLSDKMFVDMSIEDMTRALNPKVNGSMYLDEIFSQPSLDFFILFSSTASVIGNAGQSNYHAANLFMTSLAAQRRAKGLTASVMSISMTADVGFVQRTGRALEDHLRKQYLLPLSEFDIHHLFAEAVVASPPNSGRNTEIIMGLGSFTGSAESNTKPPWYDNPRLSHFITESDVSKDQYQTTSSTLPILQQLEAAQSEDLANAVLLSSFCMKLGSMMQLSSKTVNADVSLLELGCDSLLAMEIRTWFQKEVKVDVPVLKMLGGATLADICRDATRKHVASKSDAFSADTYLKKALATTDVEEACQTPESPQTDDSASPRTKDLESDFDTASITPASTPGFSEGDEFLVVDKKLEQLSYDSLERVETMSYAQSRMWFLGNYTNDLTACNVTLSYEITGKLQIPRFQRALANVISHHKSLHTCFFSASESSELKQGVLTDPRTYFRHVDTSDEAEIAKELQSTKNRNWDLKQGQGFGVTLATRNPDLHTVIFGYHHIIMDGFSWFLVLRDIDLAYRMMPLEPVSKQYVDYTVEQNLLIQEKGLEQQLDFWRREYTQLPDPVPLLPFARVKSRKAIESYDCNTVSTVINKDLATKIKKASQILRVTEFHFHLTVIQALLARLLDLEDICIGITDANRDDKLANTVGFFLNLLPLRFQVYDTDQFSSMARQTSNKAFQALSNSAVPFDLLLDRLNVPRSSTHSPLFQVALNYRMGDMWQVPLGDCQMNLDSYIDARGQYDLSFNVTRTANGTSLLEINSLDQLYSSESTRVLLDIYVHLLESFSEDPSAQLCEVSLFNPAKTEQAITMGRGPRTTYTMPNTLSECFDIVRRRHPDDIAVRDSTGSFSYSQLASQVNEIAITILDSGLSPGSHIAVLCQPSMGTIACILAILRTGCVYVPLDLSLPCARHSSILRLCDPDLILCQTLELDVAKELAGDETRVIDISHLPQAGSRTSERIGTPDSPAFLLCTSGSTGTPKGIVLAQAGFMNFLASLTEILPRQDKEIVLQQSSYGFDMSICQVFYALAFGDGGTLIIVPQAARGDPVEISKRMLETEVTMTLGTPSEYLMILRYGQEFLSHYSSWRHACSGGESVTDALKREFRGVTQHQVELTDFYGPTEISAATTARKLLVNPESGDDSDRNPVVGKALANTSIYIVDENCKPVPLGFPGEICVGGVGVVIGYLDLPDLNSSKFLSDPFVSVQDIAKGWTRMYKTGDQGRLSEDGALIFMGRNGGDTQVKLRGLRIELDDVANNLLQASDGLLSDAVVTVRGDPQFLVAHVVIAPGKSASDEEVQQIGQNLPLPQYMCPAMTIPLLRLPTNNNGKTDRKAIEALPLPEFQSVPKSHKPLTLSQGELKLVWRDVLQQASSNIGLDSDFFMAGGNSLLLVKLQGAIKEKIGVSLQLRDMYGSSTLVKMASLIASEKGQQPLQEAAIDWDTETAVPESMYIDVQQKQIRKASKTNGIEVLLTGATSFLGAAILALLLKDDKIRKIHCLAVAAESQMTLPQSEKIVAYTGTLIQKNLGLSEAQYTTLQAHIDIIIHAGANGHCLNNYFSLKVPNLDSTRFLAELALPRSIPIHYISSNRVALLSGSAALPPVSVADHHPETDGSEGYTATKWASECFLEKVAKVTSLPVCVHRNCALVGEKAPSEDALNALIKFSIMMRAVPRFDNFEGFFDFKEVHAVAGEIVDDVMKERAGADKLEFRHHSGGERIPVDEFGEHLERRNGVPVKKISVEEWMEKAIELGIEDLIVGYLNAVVEREGTITFPYMGATE